MYKSLPLSPPAYKPRLEIFTESIYEINWPPPRDSAESESIKELRIVYGELYYYWKHCNMKTKNTFVEFQQVFVDSVGIESVY